MDVLTIALAAALFMTFAAAVMYFDLYWLERNAHLLTWSLGFLAYSVALAGDGAPVVGGHAVASVGLVALALVVSGTVFAIGAAQASGVHLRHWLGVVPAAVLVAEAVLSRLAPGSLTAPSSVYFAAVLVWSGSRVLHFQDSPGPSRHMVAWSLGLWGVCVAAYSWFHGVDDLAAVTITLVALFVLSSGLGGVLMHLHSFRARVLDSERDVVRQSHLLDQVSDGVIGLDSDLKLTAWSATAARMFDLPAADVLGRGIRDVLDGDLLGQDHATMFRALQEVGEVAWTMRLRLRNGTERYIEFSGRRLGGDVDDSTSFTAVARDVTDRFLTAARVRESEDRYRTLFEASPIPLWEEDFTAVKSLLDALRSDGVTDIGVYLDEHPEVVTECVSRITVHDVNRAAVEFYGAESKEALLHGIERLADPSTARVFRDEFVALSRGETFFRSEIRARRFDGAVLSTVFTLVVPPGYEETLSRVLVCDIDLTDRKRAEAELDAYRASLEVLVEERTAELVRANEELLDATKAKDRFLANVSHEMRTPLNSIIGFTGIVSQGWAGEIPDEVRTQLEMANRSGKQLLAMVNDLLEFSRIESGTVSLDKRPVELQPFIASACEMVSVLARDKGLGVTCGPVDAPRIVTDPARAQQILLNLLSNAVKFTEEGTIIVDAHTRDGQVRIGVRDTGPGIAEQDRESVFRAFYQLAPLQEAKHSGSGLGLSIARDLARLLGGDIELESVPGRGSTFTLVLPLEP